MTSRSIKDRIAQLNQQSSPSSAPLFTSSLRIAAPASLESSSFTSIQRSTTTDEEDEFERGGGWKVSNRAKGRLDELSDPGVTNSAPLGGVLSSSRTGRRGENLPEKPPASLISRIPEASIEEDKKRSLTKLSDANQRTVICSARVDRPPRLPPNKPSYHQVVEHLSSLQFNSNPDRRCHVAVTGYHDKANTAERCVEKLGAIPHPSRGAAATGSPQKSDSTGSASHDAQRGRSLAAAILPPAKGTDRRAVQQDPSAVGSGERSNVAEGPLKVGEDQGSTPSQGRQHQLGTARPNASNLEVRENKAVPLETGSPIADGTIIAERSDPLTNDPNSSKSKPRRSSFAALLSRSNDGSKSTVGASASSTPRAREAKNLDDYPERVASIEILESVASKTNAIVRSAAKTPHELPREPIIDPSKTAAKVLEPSKTTRQASEPSPTIEAKPQQVKPKESLPTKKEFAPQQVEAAVKLSPEQHQSSNRTRSGRHKSLDGRESLGGTRADYFRDSIDFAAIDAIATTRVSYAVRKTTETLSKFLTEQVQSLPSFSRLDATEKQVALLRVLQRWVGENIAYDVKSLHEGTITNEKCSPEYVLRTGMGVCAGVSLQSYL